jgi:hypothetical protein
MTIGDAHVHPGSPCPHSTGSGCDDYTNRPVDPCRNFNCGWVVPGSPLPDWLKPDNAKVIVIFDKIRWQGIPVDVAVPVGRRIPPRALQWLQEFARKHGRPLLYAEQDVVDGAYQPQQNFSAFGPPAFQQFIQQRQGQGKPLW